MPLFAKTYQELVSDSITDLATNTNLTRLSAGGKARSILETVSKRLETAYDVFDINLARAFVSTAGGQYLDLIGALVGVTRQAARAASVDTELQVQKFYVDTGTFGDINSGSNILVPLGTIISTKANGTGVAYRTIEDVSLLASDSSAFVAIEAVMPGAGFNVGAGALTYHQISSYTDYLNRTLKTTNAYAIANGRNFEDDTNFRYRISNQVLAAEAANLTAIRLAALSTPGVADVIIKPLYRGIGTIGVIIQSTTPTVSNTLIEAVRAKILQVAAMGDIVLVKKPKETGFTMRTTVFYSKQLTDDEMTDIEDAMNSFIVDYVNNLAIGESLFVNRLIASLFSVDPSIANFGEPGKYIEEPYIYKESRTQTSKIRQKLLGDYVPAEDERVIIEPSVENQIVFNRQFVKR